MIELNVTNLVGGNIVITTSSSGGDGETSSHSETRFTLQGGSVETYNIEGTLNRQWMVNNGYFDDSEDDGQYID